MPGFLPEIIQHKKKSIAEKKSFYASLKKKLGQDKYTRYSLFKRMISKKGEMNLIAEIKKASPSQGLLREEFDIMNIAKIYVEHKVAAISVLTEEKYFLGKPQYVKRVSDNFNVPVLVKDFVLDEGQIYEARFLGASAVLLIAAILKDSELKDFLQLAHHLDLDCLVEVHSKNELERALKINTEIIGINNRDLKTFEVSLQTCRDLIPKVPKDKVIVAESGLRTHKEIIELQGLGAHAVLIGETFMKEKDIGKKIKEVMSGK